MRPDTNFFKYKDEIMRGIKVRHIGIPALIIIAALLIAVRITSAGPAPGYVETTSERGDRGDSEWDWSDIPREPFEHQPLTDMTPAEIEAYARSYLPYAVYVSGTPELLLARPYRLEDGLALYGGPETRTFEENEHMDILVLFRGDFNMTGRSPSPGGDTLTFDEPTDEIVLFVFDAETGRATHRTVGPRFEFYANSSTVHLSPGMLNLLREGGIDVEAEGLTP